MAGKKASIQATTTTNKPQSHLRYICSSLVVLLAAFYIARSADVASITRLNIFELYGQSILNQLSSNGSSNTPDFEPISVLEPRPCVLTFSAIGPLQHVRTAVGTTLKDQDRVFLLLNGKDHGLYFPWPFRNLSAPSDCLYALGQAAGQALGVDPDLLANGVRLFNQAGRPITTAQELESAQRITHVLVDFQTWVWPGIEVGFERQVNGVIMKTLSLSPLVFSVSNFFTESEAEEIINQGAPLLRRSKINKSHQIVESAIRTSNSAVLNESALTRSIQSRGAALARLPSLSFASRLELLRYEPGEYYRHHLDPLNSASLVPEEYYALTYEDYVRWIQWAAAKCDELNVSLPVEFHQGKLWYPNISNPEFEAALLSEFIQLESSTNFFTTRSDVPWLQWIRRQLAKQNPNTMRRLLAKKGSAFLPKIIDAWNAKVERHEFLAYAAQKDVPVHGIAHFYRWIRWLKNQISKSDDLVVPPIAQRTGELYPKFSMSFQIKMAKLVADSIPEERIQAMLGDAGFATWTTQMEPGERATSKALLHALNASVNFIQLVIEAWEINVQAGPMLQYKLPKYVKNWRPNRFVTLLLYLNDVDEGGETVFTYATDQAVSKMERTEMEECKHGLALPPRKLAALLFYVQTPEEEIDWMARHGGCPPTRGVKWTGVSFMMNADAGEVRSLHGF
ncbi:unnamed protein product [Aphanomyces euteiches]|uniref:Prolyl 4-hydroxylase alpha subunit domain-containing protein n=1 Tax=Aphanomyces euteiches TaxID=100861 RepID=A0A6G0XL89_9STRA|nr:hypothetical protein Ae201684_003671 [Aphanomyces euteiches]KAH9084747.1 hypothetical protein Ae201684P_001987 [Aphanomyces euteiches]KAH9138702.1 hypothetical protein AeRB84_016994 [Aphanomyces euteiches]